MEGTHLLRGRPRTDETLPTATHPGPIGNEPLLTPRRRAPRRRRMGALGTRAQSDTGAATHLERPSHCRKWQLQRAAAPVPFSSSARCLDACRFLGPASACPAGESLKREGNRPEPLREGSAQRALRGRWPSVQPSGRPCICMRASFRHFFLNSGDKLPPGMQAELARHVRIVRAPSPGKPSP